MFDTTKVIPKFADGAFKRGNYELRFLGTTVKESTTEDSETKVKVTKVYIEIEWVITGPRYANKHVWDRRYITDDAFAYTVGACLNLTGSVPEVQAKSPKTMATALAKHIAEGVGSISALLYEQVSTNKETGKESRTVKVAEYHKAA